MSRNVQVSAMKFLKYFIVEMVTGSETEDFENCEHYANLIEELIDED